MDHNTNFNDHTKEVILDASTHIWNHVLAFLNSMALKGAIELGIPDAIYKHGKPMALAELATSLSIHPNKAPSLHQLMSLLVHSNFFSIEKLFDGEEAYNLTINSQLLLKDHPFTQAHFALLGFDSVTTEPSQHFRSWFQNQGESPFHIAQGMHYYERMANESRFSEVFNQAMSSDARFVSTLLLASNEFRGLLDGVESLVDVGGADGTMTKVIANAYPKLKCLVFDLPHVVDGLQCNERNLTYVAGDMFDEVPLAQVVLLKWVLHNWSDENCIKILKKCKAAIPSKEEGGKLLIIEMVKGIPSDNVNHSHSQFLMDLLMLSLGAGKERNEQQWKYLFVNAGFHDYKILPVLGSRSVIEVFPA